MRVAGDTFNGLGRLRGFGDVNSDAAAKLVAAGYTGVNCRPVVVDVPGQPSYVSNQCSTAQGVTPIADNVNQMSKLQLQTQLAEEQPYQGLTDAQLNDALSKLTHVGSPDAIAPYKQAAAAAAAGTSAAPTQDSINQQQTMMASWSDQLSKLIAGLTAPGKQVAPVSTATPLQTASIASNSIIPGVPDWALLAGGGLALFLFLKGGR